MKPEQLAACNTEHGHQSALFCWCNQNLDKYPDLKWFFAIPNGGERNIAVAGRLKAEGVKSGVSDLCLPVPRRGNNGTYNGLFIEMKKPKGRESSEQKEFGAFVTENGYYYEMCDHWEKARDLLIAYFDPTIALS